MQKRFLKKLVLSILVGCGLILVSVAQAETTTPSSAKTPEVAASATTSTESPSQESASKEPIQNAASKTLKTLPDNLETSLRNDADVELPEMTAGLEILDLAQYNIFHMLPKAKKVFPVYYGPFTDFTYGPYQIKSAIYDVPWLKLTEIDKRMYVLEEMMKTLPPEDPGLIEKKIHLADLRAIKARVTLKTEHIKKSVEAYVEIYQKVSKNFYPYVALNMVNSLLLMDDVITAFPIIKKIQLEFGSDKEFKKHFNTSMIELYYIAGRYTKAWDELNSLVERKEVTKESLDYRLRVGDLLFFMMRYQESSEWYQSVLKPETTKTLSENVSWLYLAESLYQLGKVEVAQKIYRAMQNYFQDTIYGDVINYRLNPSREAGEQLLKKTKSPVIKDWIQVELLKQQFKMSPGVFTGESFEDVLVDREYPEALKEQIWAMQANAYEFEKKYYKAVKLYQKLSFLAKNTSLERLYDKAILEALTKKGWATDTEKEAHHYLNFLRRFEFTMRFAEPDQLFALLKHNLDLMGMSDLSAELTLHIIDKSIHRPQDKAAIYLKLAEALLSANSDQAALKALELVDTALIDYEQKEKYYHLNIEGLERTKRFRDALVILTEWENEGTSAKNVYQIALRKVEIFAHTDKVQTALSVIEDVVGSGKFESLPADYQEYINPLLAYQVILNNKTGKNFEALANFYSHQDRILTTKYKSEAMLAALSSALAMNKKSDVVKLMAVAKENFDKTTYEWLGQWTRGDMWINQINNYLDERTTASQTNGG